MRSDQEPKLQRESVTKIDWKDNPSSITTVSQVAPIFAIGADRAQANQALNQKLLALLADITEGQREAFAQLYDQTSGVVYALALRILCQGGRFPGGREAAEEVTLDVFNQIWQQSANYDNSRGAPLAWLIMMTRSRALDRLRATANGSAHERENIQTVSQTATDGHVPETVSLFAENRTLVYDMLAQLKPKQRLLIETAFYEGLSHSEMAERFQLPLGTVKTYIRDGMRALRKCLFETASA